MFSLFVPKNVPAFGGLLVQSSGNVLSRESFKDILDEFPNFSEFEIVEVDDKTNEIIKNYGKVKDYVKENC